MKFCVQCGGGSVNSAEVCLRCRHNVFSSVPSIVANYQSTNATPAGTSLRAVGIESPEDRHTREAAVQTGQHARALERAKELQAEANAPARCPECGSSQLTAQKHGVSGLKAAGGFLTLGPFGLLAGLHGSRKVDVSCVKCGHSWKAGS